MFSWKRGWFRHLNDHKLALSNPIESNGASLETTILGAMNRYGLPYIPVPELFFPFESKEPFKECSRCSKELIDSNTEYFIEKALKPNDTIYEYAVCYSCAESVQRKMSEDSLQKVNDFFAKRMRLLEHRHLMLEKHDLDYSFWLDHCVVEGTPASEMQEYQIMAHCQGPNMIFSVFPYCLGSNAADQLVSVLSAETLEELDHLGDELIDIPPELRSLWHRKPILV